MGIHKPYYCDTIGCKMAHAVKGIVRLMEQKFKEHGLNLTIEQYFVLNILDNDEPFILQDLAEIMDKDKSAILRHINGLEENRYVVRAEDPDDRRRKQLLVTKKGAEAFSRAHELSVEVNRSVAPHIDAESLETLKTDIDKMYKNTITLLNS